MATQTAMETATYESNSFLSTDRTWLVHPSTTMICPIPLNQAIPTLAQVRPQTNRDRTTLPPPGPSPSLPNLTLPFTVQQTRPETILEVRTRPPTMPSTPTTRYRAHLPSRYCHPPPTPKAAVHCLLHQASYVNLLLPDTSPHNSRPFIMSNHPDITLRTAGPAPQPSPFNAGAPIIMASSQSTVTIISVNPMNDYVVG